MTVLTSGTGAGPFLPAKVTDVPKDMIRNFQHSKKVGNYLLGRTIGEGSFAKVKEGLHLQTGDKVAIKVIDKRKAKEDAYVRKNLRREGKLLQQVRHPNIVQLLEIMETENSYYLVMELCLGGDLMDYICRRKKLEEREVKKFVRQIISAIDYLHRLGILHRDLKVENLLLDGNKDIKLIDFGLGNSIKILETKEGVRAQEVLVTQCGSPAYAAPELLGRKKYGPQVDVWSIGVNMYAMLTGSLPFTVDPFNIKVLYNKMLTGQMNPLPDNITRECRDLIKKFLTPEPEKRIALTDAMKHPWLTEGLCKEMEQFPCPNKLRSEHLDDNILKHMSENHGFRIGEVIRFVIGNVPSPALALYFQLQRKLERYMSDLRVKGRVPAMDSHMLHQRRLNNKHKDRYGIVNSGASQRLSDACKNTQTHSIFGDKEVNNNRNESPNRNTQFCGKAQGSDNLQRDSKQINRHNKETVEKVRRCNCAHLDNGTKSVTSKEHEQIDTIQRCSPCSLPGRKIHATRIKTVHNHRKCVDNKENNEKRETSTSPTRQKVTITETLGDSSGTNIKQSFIKKTEVKLINNKKLIDLAFSPYKRPVQRRSLSLESSHSQYDSSEYYKRRTIHQQRPIEAFAEFTSIDRISPSSSKTASSRATIRSEKSYTVRDLALPCISPVPNSKSS